MTTLFYLMACVAMLIEVFQVSAANGILNENKFYTKYKKEHNDNPPPLESWSILMFSVIFNICLILWAMIGLLSSQWLLCLLLLLLKFIGKGKYVWVFKLKHLISFLILLFTVLNKYQFHIDLVKLLINN